MSEWKTNATRSLSTLALARQDGDVLSCKGMTGERKGPGSHGFKLSIPNGESLIVQAQIMGPAAAEATVVPVLSCPRHGLDGCSPEGEGKEPCSTTYLAVKAPRWQVLVREISKDGFEVHTLRLPEARTLKEALAVNVLPPEELDVDFVVMAWVLAPMQQEEAKE